MRLMQQLKIVTIC